MGYTFLHKPFPWTNVGQDPTQAEINLGLQGGMALPAPYVNAQWTETYKAIKEIQDYIEAIVIDASLDENSDNAVKNKAIATAVNKLISDIAPTETSPAASAHASGNYFIYNGVLYKAKTSISAGDTLTVGTNIETANVITVLTGAISAINTALAGKVDKENGKGLSSNDFSGTYKTMLDNVDTEVTEDSTHLVTSGGVYDAIQQYTPTITVDSELSTSSENPVQNKVITNTLVSLLGVSLPTQNGTLTYNGSSQSPVWNGYDNNKLTLSGTTSGTNAGTYTATFTPVAPYMWADGTRTPKNVDWSIGRATGTLTLSSSTANTLKNATTTITLTANSDGAKSVDSSSTSIVTASLSGNTITLTGGSTSGSATVTVSIAQSTNYNAVSKTISVTNTAASSTLSENTPATIKAVAQAGRAANLWSVGDKTAAISMSGNVGSLSLSGSYYAFILGFNHNSSREGSNSIHFALGMTSNGTRIAFCDGSYNTQISSNGFNMNTSNSNSGGWSGSQMRTNIMPAFKSAMPSAWRNVIASCTKYSDNTGGGSDTASYVTSTSDYMFLLSEFEVHGSRSYANSAEQNYQKQYDYFKNGNGKIFYKHNATTTACYWWCRSVLATDADIFCFVDTGGNANGNGATFSFGVVLGFTVA